MKTNYLIGETYYDYGDEVKLISIRDNEVYPLYLVRKKDGLKFTYTLDGRHLDSFKPSLSTSPTEFIAPKEKNFISWEDVYKKSSMSNRLKDGITELLPPPGEGKFYRIEGNGIYTEDTPKKSYTQDLRDTKTDKAIQLLKSEGYTITKQY